MKNPKDKAVVITYTRPDVPTRLKGGAFLTHPTGKFFIVFTGENQNGGDKPLIGGCYIATLVNTRKYKLVRKKLVSTKQCDKNFN